MKGFRQGDNSFKCLLIISFILTLIVIQTQQDSHFSSFQQQVDQNTTNESQILRSDLSNDHQPVGNALNISARVASSDFYRPCDSTFYDRDFFFTTLNYPQQYDNNLDCVIIVKRGQDACHLQLTFQSFELEETQSCLADFLEIDGRRLCGTLPPNSIRTYSFNKPEIKLHFRSNAVITNKGFFIRGNQLNCGQQPVNIKFPNANIDCCDRTFNEPEFTITSPPIPINVDCTYTIRKSNIGICSLQITLVSLELKNSPQCLTDFLEFNHHRFCFSPETRTQYFEFLEDVFYIRYQSSGARNQPVTPSFQLHIRQIPCRNSPPGVPNPPFSPPTQLIPQNCYLGLNDQSGRPAESYTRKLQFTLRSPAFPLPYPPNQKCDFTVLKAVSNICFLKLSVETFELQSEFGCALDYLSIDGQRLCGTLPAESSRIFNFPNDELVIRFVSNDYQSGRGFSLVFQQQPCVVPPSPPVIPPVPQPLPPSPRPPPLPFQPSLPNPNCDATFTTGQFQISHPSIDILNACCTYTIRRLPGVCALKINFELLEFGVVDNSHCGNSYLEIADDKFCCLSDITKLYSFDKDIFVIRFRPGLQRPKFLINVHQQKSCSMLPPSLPPLLPSPLPPVLPPQPTPLSPWLSCGLLYNSKFDRRTFQLQSPNYPSPYEPNLNCISTAVRANANICKLQIRFNDFQLENSYKCQNDFLEINGVKLCGDLPIGTIKLFPFLTNEILIRFHSNQILSGRGFLLDIAQLDCYLPAPPTLAPFPPLPTPPPTPSPPPIYPLPVPPICRCNYTYQVPQLTLQSELYPAPYPPSLNCYYLIHKIHPDICQLEVRFEYFNVGIQSPVCNGDYVDIGGQRHCGIIPAGTIRRYPFSTPSSIHLNFVSGPRSLPESRFLLHLRQLSCNEPVDPTPSPPSTCDAIQYEQEFHWTSPGYPSFYPDRQDCTLTIRRNNPSVCSLLVTFRQFDVEQSVGCAQDYLEIFGQRLCGHLQDGTERHFTFRQELTVVKFHSDYFGRRSGFHLIFQQLMCLDGPVVRNAKASSDSFDETLTASTTENSAEILPEITVNKMLTGNLNGTMTTTSLFNETLT